MAKPLTYLQKRLGDDWLIGYDCQQLITLAEELLTQLLQRGTSPKILLAEKDPIKFIAGFIAATTANYPVFLCNPNWVKAEWEQVFNLVQPDIIWGELNFTFPHTHTPKPVLNTSHSGLIMIPTGGSSGEIKFAIHTWQTLMASVQGFTKYFAIDKVNSFCVLPLYHVSGLMQFMRSLTTNGQLVILPFKTLETSLTPFLVDGEGQGVGFSNYSPSPIIDLINNINTAEFFLSLVPTQLQRLLNHSSTWLSNFHTILLGGAPAWLEILEAARFHRIRLAPTYGMTETASQIATLKPEAFINGINNCGHILPHAQIKICNEQGEILSNNQIGIITIQSQSLALGYYPNLFTNKQNFTVDDLGFIDDNGYLNIIGRNSNKIITGGENVFPTEVEAAILATKLVTDVGVLGLPDKHWGQVVAAVYVPINLEVSNDILKNVITNKISKFKQPKYWIAVDKLPRNQQGKVNREQLEKIAITWQLHHSNDAAIA
ncbi:o-succinylbenzoate--CoA ligase [Crinalium epipsammum PCC 9333]|uniref:O-succinylbenzoate--CoA ligase n=1 Tax=Crinalium epipsammum PCC 9333 TaxID=1173022 RepID=K9W4F6_9CYAN|nr:2-succinylbenzoate--CoA ligase [Crinalium epipsammum]AFZ14679.1 o-succinylbenzoate--CoA ligase [Crinalium epipsammum PCC 9333]